MSDSGGDSDGFYEILAMACFVGEACIVCGGRLEMSDLLHAKASAINPVRPAHLRCWQGCMAVIRNAVEAESVDSLVRLAVDCKTAY